jgi:sugar/nucleoside kinase (ribokinase family)
VSITVVGTIGIDSIGTPFGHADDALGGSASYFALAAANFQQVNIVAVVGSDLPDAALDLLRASNIDLNGIERANGKNFRWGGRYHMDFNTRDTLFTELGVLATFDPKVPPSYASPDILFLANLTPTVQASVIRQAPGTRIRVLDTMNFWISNTRDDLTDVIRQVQVVIIAEDELREYAGMSNLRKAAQTIFDLGPSLVVIKQGSYGALLLEKSGAYFAAPAFPLNDVVDPTGAGDSFAGGFLGYLASVMAKGGVAQFVDFKRALLYGNILGSFTCEAFGVERLLHLSREDIAQRYYQLIAFTHIEASVPSA